MKHIKTYILSLAALMMAACSEDALVANGGRPEAGMPIAFDVHQSETRTAYETDINSFQIIWNSTQKDSVKLYAPYSKISDTETGPSTGIYEVQPSSDGKDGTLKHAAKTNIRWGAQDHEHLFYAAYGKDVTWKVVENDGIYAKCKFLSQQTAKVTQASGTAKVAVADMSGAYMVAKSDALKPADMSESKVFLNFKPIMTTLQITVKGYEATKNLSLSSVMITVPASSDVTYREGDDPTDYFDYKVDGTLHDVPLASDKKEQNITVRLSETVTLAPGEKLTLTAILPPVKINSSSPVKILVMSPDGPAEASFNGGTNGVRTADKALITCKAFVARSQGNTVTNTDVAPGAQTDEDSTSDDSAESESDEPDTYNDWQKYLPDNALVCSVTMPGTNYSGCYLQHGNTFRKGHRYQATNLRRQVAQGNRVFDFRPMRKVFSSAYCVEGDGDEGDDGTGKFSYAVWDYNESQKDSKFEIGNVFKNFLNNYPTEFCIVFIKAFRGEKSLIESNGVTITNVGGVLSNKWAGKIVLWKPDLTVKECRGKIVVVMRNDYITNHPYSAQCYWSRSTDATGGYVKSQSITQYNNTTVTGTLYYQDYTGADADKTAAMQAVADHSYSNHTGAKANYWYLNNASNDKGNVLDSKIKSEGATNNSAMINIVNAAQGPIGMVLMNRAGSSTANGPALVNALINHNFKDGVLRYAN